MVSLKTGDHAYDFELKDQSGKTHRLKDYRGKWVVLYFYPRDDTPGCTKEACNFRDSLVEFQKTSASVIGISTDSVESHGKFSQKYSLNFPILSDIEKKVEKAYGVWGEKKFMGRTYMGTKRTSFLIDPEGIIKKIYEKVDTAKHAKEVIDDLSKLA